MFPHISRYLPISPDISHLLHHLHGDRGLVGEVVREVDVDVRLGEVAVGGVAEHAAREVERQGGRVGEAEHARPGSGSGPGPGCSGSGLGSGLGSGSG